MTMPSHKQTFRVRQASTGRGFAVMDPERQREIATQAVPGSVRPIEVRPTRPVQIDWMRACLQRDAKPLEGSSSR